MNFDHGLELLTKLGLMGPPLLLTSLAALALTLERVAFLYRERPRAKQVERRLGAHLNGGNWSAADSATDAIPGPLAVLAREFMAARHLPQDLRQRDCETLMGSWLSRARGRIKTLVTLAQIAPLLGLTGTVLGLVGTFRVIGASSHAVDPSLLAGGIWEALLTTVAGMVISIPLLVVVRILQSRVESTTSQARTLYAWLERRLHLDSEVATETLEDRNDASADSRFRALS